MIDLDGLEDERLAQQSLRVWLMIILNTSSPQSLKWALNIQEINRNILSKFESQSFTKSVLSKAGVEKSPVLTLGFYWKTDQLAQHSASGL